jgi:hypothetical protein
VLRTFREGAWASLLLILRWGEKDPTSSPISIIIIHICKKVGLAALPRNPLNFVGVRVHDVIPRCNQMVAQASSLCTKESVLTGSQVERGNPAKLCLATLSRWGGPPRPPSKNLPPFLPGGPGFPAGAILLAKSFVLYFPLASRWEIYSSA